MKKYLGLLLLLGITVSFTFSGKLPSKWFKAGSKPDAYEMGVDELRSKNGGKSAYIFSKNKKIKGFGTLMQTCSAEDYLNTKGKMTGYIRSENIKGWAGMWLRVDGKDDNCSLIFDNMHDSKIKVTTDWKKCEIVLTVPKESTSLNYGILLTGTGKVWFDDVSFEIVDKAADVTSYPLPGPVNIDFED